MNAPLKAPPAGSTADADRPRYEDEDEFEPMFGLPEIPPEDEHILWQGRPTVTSIAYRVFHSRMVALYFAALLIWSVVDDLAAGLGWQGALLQASVLLIPLATFLALVWGAAWAIATTTVYTVTSKRVVIRAGVAISKAVNLPFKQIAGADARTSGDGTTDLLLRLDSPTQLAYLLVWPHARPFKWSNVEPMLRGIKDGEAIKTLLAEALYAYHGRRPGAAADMTKVKDKAPAAADTDLPVAATP